MTITQISLHQQKNQITKWGLGLTTFVLCIAFTIQVIGLSPLVASQKAIYWLVVGSIICVCDLAALTYFYKTKQYRALSFLAVAFVLDIVWVIYDAIKVMNKKFVLPYDLLTIFSWFSVVVLGLLIVYLTKKLFYK